MIEFSFVKGQPEYLQIAETIQLAAASGRLHPGDRLEPVRELARRLGLNPGTVARSYRILEQRGVIETGGRRGSRIASSAPAADESSEPLHRTRLRSFASRAVLEGLAQGFEPEELEAAFGLELAACRQKRSGAAVREHAGRNEDRLNSFAGSHDLALEALWAQLRRLEPPLSITPRYVGSLDGLLALLHGEVVLAGAHLLDEESGEYNIPILRRLFIGVPVCAAALAEREQGLIVAPGNPKRIRGFPDLSRAGLRFANRQPGSGTRALLDRQLRLHSVKPADVSGYERVLSTHLDVAAAVAEGTADAGLGILAAARAYGLDFLPLAKERYDLVFAAEDRRSTPLREILEVLASVGFRSVVGRIGGYDTSRTAEERVL